VAPELLGPFLEEGVANTEVARPRHVQLIPSRYAIKPRAVKTVHIRRQVYLDLTTIMEQDGTFDDCRDVLVWLRTASTARGGGGAHSGDPLCLLVVPWSSSASAGLSTCGLQNPQ
jgi:hypothetical protein